jgi:hypothetical protein
VAAGGTVTNLGSAAYISGAATAIRAGGTVASTVINQGRISGGATAVQFAPVAGNLLRLIPGEGIVGTVFGGGAGQDKLELAAGIHGGNVAGIGTRFTGFSSLVVDNGATWLMTSTNTISASYLTLSGSGELKVTGMLTAPGNFSIAGGGTLAAFDSGRIEVGLDASARSGQIVVDAGHTFSPNASLAARAVVNRGSIAGGADLVVASSLINSGSITSDDAGAGVRLEQGGVVTNSGFIVGDSNGVDIAAPGAGGAAVVVNQGTIGGGSDGVLLHTPGTVTNSGGTIIGVAYAGVQLLGGGTVANTGEIAGAQWGIYASGGAATVSYQGTLLGFNGDGLYFAAGGTLTNTGAAAVVAGAKNGVYVSGGRGDIVNQGSIGGLTEYGVFLGAGGVVTNGAGTVINAGTVSGTSTTGVGVLLGLGGVVANNGTGAVISGQLSGVIAENSPAAA